MNRKFYNKIINLLPSKDLVNCIKAEKFVFDEKYLLKFINDYAPDFNKKMELFKEAATVFCDRKAKQHAKRLIEYNEKAYAEFMRADENCVYEIKFKCLPDDSDDEETLLTKTFDDAIKMIRNWLKCYRDIGVKDNVLSRYTIFKKTVTLPRYPRDIYNGKVGTLGMCFLGYRLHILDLSMYTLNNEMCRKATASCLECKSPCIAMLEPKFPRLLNKYDLVAFYDNKLYNPTKISYGILGVDMEKYDDFSDFIYLDNEYIKTRNAEYKDEDGYYRVFDAHCHPSYAEIFKPDINNVPKEVYDDYLYAVEVLKKIDDQS